MTHSVHSGEEEVVLILDDVARELTISRVRSPIILYLPALILNPFSST